ncbi:MAG: TlpA disulfide reductase family protein [Pirellulales bacterium]
MTARNNLPGWALLVALGGVALTFWGCGGTPVGAASQADAKAAAKYPLPEGGPEQLLEFAAELDARDLEGKTAEEQRADYSAQLAGMLAAADKVLASDAPAELKARASGYKLKALITQFAKLDEPGSREALDKFATQLKSSDNKELAEQGQWVLDRLDSFALQAKVDRMLSQPELAGEVLAGLKDYFAKQGATGESAELALNIARMIEAVGDIPRAREAYQIVAQQFGTNTLLGPRLQPVLAAAEKRLGVFGQPLEIVGKTVSGQPLDWSKYKGKVVLVDFWATWCGPCIGEIPNMKAAYEKFHDRGFEIVAVSIDDDRADVEAFLQKNPVPWTVVHNKSASVPEDPNAEKFGVEALPTMFLVDQSGKVVALQTRGPRLEEELERLLGQKKS